MTIWPRKHKRKTPSQAFTRSKQIYRIGRSLKFCGTVHRQRYGKKSNKKHEDHLTEEIFADGEVGDSTSNFPTKKRPYSIDCKTLLHDKLGFILMSFVGMTTMGGRGNLTFAANEIIGSAAVRVRGAGCPPPP